MRGGLFGRCGARALQHVPRARIACKGRSGSLGVARGGRGGRGRSGSLGVARGGSRSLEVGYQLNYIGAYV